MAESKLRFKREDGTEFPEWEYKELGSLCTLTNGISKGKEYFGHGNRMINLQDVFGTNYLCDNSTFDLVEVTESELAEKKVIKGDVVFVRSSVKPSGVGLPCVIEGDMKDTVFSGFIIRARFVQNNLFLNYKRYCFLESDFRKAVMKKCSISANTNINQENLAKIRVKIPCIEEQQKIADFLSTVDEVIAQSEAEVQNLEQQKKAVMQKIFSQKVRFKHEDGTEFPEWEEKELEEVSKRITDGSHFSPKGVEKGYYMPSVKDMRDNGFDFSQSKMISEEDFISLKNQGCCPEIGDVLIAKDGSILKYSFAIKQEADFVILSSIAIIKPIISILDSEFLAQHFKLPAFVDSTIIANKTGSGVPRIVLKNFKKMRIKIPCLKEQQKIADFLSAYDEAITYAKQELGKWKELKKGLLQQLFI